MNFIADPLLENILYSVEQLQPKLPVIDISMDNPTDYSPPYLKFGFEKFRITREFGNLWRVHEIVMEYVFDAPDDNTYLDTNLNHRNLIKSHYSNQKLNELNQIIFQLVKADNPFAQKYTGNNPKGTDFRLPNRFSINGDVKINRYGADENQNWSILVRFELMSLEKIYNCKK